jgi:hypothetical protein
MLVVWDTLTGDYTVDFVVWLFEHGIMPFFTPLGGSSLNMAKSSQWNLKRRARRQRARERRLALGGSGAYACRQLGRRQAA